MIIQCLTIFIHSLVVFLLQFDPAAKSMWRHWRGTVLAETWVSAVKHFVWAIFVYLLMRRYSNLAVFWEGFDALWVQMVSISTFTLSFFVNQAYTLWRTCLTISRTLQGRVSDIMMTLCTHATRYDDPETKTSTYTPGSRKFLNIMARYVRLFHILCYGSFTRSHRPLLTPRGMRRLVERGVMTKNERQVLIEASKVSATQRFNVILMWIGRSIIEARKANILEGGPGFEQSIINKLQDARGQANSIEAQLRGRMVSDDDDIIIIQQHYSCREKCVFALKCLVALVSPTDSSNCPSSLSHSRMLTWFKF
jgi:hypothetical protein